MDADVDDIARRADTVSPAGAEATSLRVAIADVGQLHGSIRRPIAGIVATGVAAGIAEAIALIAFVRAAVAITTDNLGDLSIANVTVDLSPGSLLVVAIALSLVAALLHVVLARASVRLGERVSINARERLIDGFLEAQWSHVARYREGRLQEAISVLTENTTRATTHLAVGLSSIVILVALGVAAVAASPLVSLGLMGVPLLCFVLARPHLRRLRSRSHLNVRDSMGLSEATASTANLALEYRTTGTQHEQAQRLKAVAGAHAAGVARTRTAGFTMTFLFKDVALIALITVVGALYLVTDLRAASLTAAVLLVIRMLGYLQQAFRLVQEGAEDVATINALHAAIADLEQHREPNAPMRVERIDTVVLDDVHYAYEPDRPALDGVTLEIELNTTIGVIGPSGAGKSTVAELLLGLRQPQRGSILVNGIPLADVARSDWSRLTALVPQHQQLAELSVAENIRFLRAWIDDAAIIHASRQAHVHDEITALPAGFEQVVGTRNLGLSGGQRQRIAIARALAGNPQLLVLDEPTSALDAATEQLFRQTLDELHGLLTIVVIAHRPASLQACDTVVHLRHGRVEKIEDGPRRLRDADAASGTARRS